MKEVNKLTRRLLAQGYTPEDTPPGMKPYQECYGGWTYSTDALKDMVFETPCGLLANGWKFTNGHMSYMGIDWIPENNNPTVCCPKFTEEPCPLLHPVLREMSVSHRTDDIARQCACHLTDRPYTFEDSVDFIHKQVWQEADERWELFKSVHKGRVCKLHSHYERTAKKWKILYRPMDCVGCGLGCQYCDVLAKDMNPQKGNVFYDVRRSWIEQGVGFFPDQQKVVIEKGIKLLKKSESLTICDAIVKYARHEIEWRVKRRYRQELLFNPTLRIEVENLRAERRETRDIFQDLKDIENGIQVTHAADTLKAAQRQKQERRVAAKERRIREIEKMILEHGWDALDAAWKRRAEKLLDDDWIEVLVRQHKENISNPAVLSQEEETQFSLFVL